MDRTETAYITEDDLLALGSDARVEVVDGEIVEMSPTGGLHVLIGDNVYRLLYPTVSGRKLGYLFSDSLIYHLSREGRRLVGSRVPDLSFVRWDQVPADWDLEKPFPGAPTLAVEVMSPDDEIEDVLGKVREYFAAGTEQVWLVFPRQQEVHVYRRDAAQVHVYREQDVMDAGELFPGLMISLADIFARPSREE